MTIDDHSSIYVGGLPYDITEEGLRRVFDMFGAVLAVKIINDRTIGGKCYGFVTFANPRSATVAIIDMDGKTIDGRPIKVNEVRTRGGRSNFNRDNSRYDLERSPDDDDDGRDHRRDYGYDRQRHHEGHRERSQGYDQNRERGHDRMRGYHRSGNRYVDEERYEDYNRNLDDVEPHLGRKREHDWERENDKYSELQRNIHHKNGDKDKQQPRLLNRSRFDERGSREHSFESLSDADMDQGENSLAISNQKLEDIRKEINRMEEQFADKQEAVSKLQDKRQKLEDSLIQAKRFTSHRQMLLTKLHKCYLQTRECDDRLKKSEQELQWMVDSSLMELGSDS